MLNISYILNKYSQSRLETVSFFLDYLLPVSLRLPKLILFSARIVYDVVHIGVSDNESQRRINHLVKATIEEDLRRCHERSPEDITRLSNAVRQIEEKYVAERKPPLLCFQEQALAMS